MFSAVASPNNKAINPTIEKTIFVFNPISFAKKYATIKETEKKNAISRFKLSFVALCKNPVINFIII